MGQHSDIQWCDSTVNPTTGCDGCELWIPGRGGPCYAGALHEGRLAKSLPLLYAPTFTEVRLAPGRMAKAAAWPDLRGRVRPDKPWIPPAMPRLIFVGDMGDVMSEAVPFGYLKTELVDVARSKAGSRHNWLVLTKRPARLAEFARWCAANGEEMPANIWAGTSITGKASLSRIDALLGVPGTNGPGSSRMRTRFLSMEPLLSAVDLDRWFPQLDPDEPSPESCCPECGGTVACEGDGYRCVDLSGVHCGCGWRGDGPDARPSIDWVIVGGESGPRARPCDLAWIRSARDQCRAAGAPVFVKQLGSRPECRCDERDLPRVGGSCLDNSCRRLKFRGHHGGDWDEWPEDLRVRQFPEVAG